MDNPNNGGKIENYGQPFQPNRGTVNYCYIMNRLITSLKGLNSLIYINRLKSQWALKNLNGYLFYKYKN